MSLNVTGYPLEFDAILHTDNFTPSVKTVKDNLASLTKINTEIKVTPVLDLNDIGKAALILSKIGNSEGAKDLKTQFYQADEAVRQLTASIANIKGATPFNQSELDKQNNALATAETKLKGIVDQVLKIPKEGIPKLIPKDVNNNPPDETPKVEKAVQAYTRLRQLKNEIAQMAIDGGRGTEEYEKLNEEAIRLQNSLRNTNKEISLAASNVSGIAAVTEGVRGMVGAFEAVSGAITLFGGDSKEAEEATKKVIGAMGILNGLQEITTLLSKESAVNFYLEGLMHKSAAASATEHAVATEGLVVAEGEQVVATEAATVAQEGLNVAMLANPVGIILASLVAIYGAYLIYAHTIGKATDAEATRKAFLDALRESQEKSVESIAKEEGALNEYIATAKNELITREQRQTALDEAKTKFPGYLADINLENISTAKTSELLAKQIELIKQKALVQASGDVYQEKLKAQIAAQNELNDVIENGTTIGQRARAFFSQSFTEDAKDVTIRLKQEALKDATNQANGAFENQNKLMQDLGNAYMSDADKIENYITRLDKAIAHGSFFAKSLAEIEKASAELQLKTASTVKPFNQEEFDKEKSKLLEKAQYRIDLDRNSFDAKRKLIQTTYDEEMVRIKGIYGDTSIGLDQQKVAYGKYLSQITALDEEYRQKKLQADIDAANATTIALQAAGKGNSEAYFDARITAIKAASEKELDAARFNADSTKQIYAKLNLDLIQNEFDRQKSILQARIDGNEAEILLSEKGSKEELNLKIANIVLESQKELDVIGLTEAKKKEIRIKSEKDVYEAIQSFNIKLTKDNDNVRISDIQAKIDVVKKGSQEELSLQQELITAKQRLAIYDEETSADAEKVKISKIEKINKDAYADRLILEENFIKSLLDLRNKAVEDAKSHKNADLDLIINDVTSSFTQKAEAERQKLQNNYDALQKEINNVQNQLTIAVLNPNGEDSKLIDDLTKKLLDLEDAAKAALLAITNNASKNTGLDKTSKEIDKLATGFSALANGARDLDANLFKIIGTLSEITNAVKVAIDGFKAFKADKGDTSAQIGDVASIAAAAATVTSMVVNAFKNAHDSKVKAEAELRDYQFQLINGQVEYNALLRQQELSQQNIADLTLQELETRKKLLETQKQQAQADFDSLLRQIQLQGKQITGEHTVTTNALGGSIGLHLLGTKKWYRILQG